MEIPQVEAFLAVGTFGGFRRAADALRITQPAVSARIRALPPPPRSRDGLPPGRPAHPGGTPGRLAGTRAARAPRGGGGSTARLLRPGLERLDAHAWPLPPGRARPQRGAGGRDDRDREEDGRARRGLRVPPPPRRRAGAPPAHPARDWARRPRAHQPESRRDPPARAATLRRSASALGRAAVGARAGRRTGERQTTRTRGRGSSLMRPRRRRWSATTSQAGGPSASVATLAQPAVL